MTISEALQKKITEEHINQNQLSKTLGIHKSLMSQIISGKRTPSLEVVKAIYRQYPDLVDILLK